MHSKTITVDDFRGVFISPVLSKMYSKMLETPPVALHSIKCCSSKNRTPLVDGNHFFPDREEVFKQHRSACGVYWSDVIQNLGWVMFLSLSGVTGSLPVLVFYVVDFNVLAADFTSVNKF